MNYLLDTHILLWAILSPKTLSQKATEILLDPEQTKYVSMLTFWEISLKYSLGKLDLTGIMPEQFPTLVRETGFEIATLDIEIVASFYKLPQTHKDPFDRMLVWQAIMNKYTLISKDATLAVYKPQGLNMIW